MKFGDITFFDTSKAVYGEVQFLYNPVASTKDKWLNVVSINTTELEASFVFRINREFGFFQIYFGDGRKIHEAPRINVDYFLAKSSLLKYWRGIDFVFLSLETNDIRIARFSWHKDIADFNSSASIYKEGDKEKGVDVMQSKFCNLPAKEISLAMAESLLFDSSDILKDNNYYASLNRLGEAYYALNNHSKALICFEAAASSNHKSMDMIAFTKVRACINSLYNAEDIDKAWIRFSSPIDSAFGRAREAIFLDNRDPLAEFKKAVENVSGVSFYDFSTNEVNLLTISFEILLRGSKGQASGEFPIVYPTKIAIVSGMGWSGSGAVYDYLKEFSEFLPIKGETPYIESSKSLRTIHSSLGNNESLRREVFAFFFYNLIGHSHYKSHNDFKLFMFARKKMMGKDREKYLTSVRDWCLVASAVMTENGEKRNHYFSQLSELTISRFTVGAKVPDGKIALLDNTVHIENSFNCIKFLNNATLLCTFRDPRSNYVALLREASHYKSSVQDFLIAKKKHYKQNFQAVGRAKEFAETVPNLNVEFIQFEEFVISEKFRNRLAERMGLSFERQRKHHYFKPWESLKNVFLHQEHPRQDDIELIEHELSQYCVEPSFHHYVQAN
jgi:tetratricopeptide (TPR) repeat protein